MSDKTTLYEPLPFLWVVEQGTATQSFYITFDTFSISLKWRGSGAGGTGRLTKFGKGRGDITEWELPSEQYTLTQAKQFMQDRAMEILARYFRKVTV